MALKLGTSLELWALLSEMHSEFPVFFQNTGKISKNGIFWKVAMTLKLDTSII